MKEIIIKSYEHLNEIIFKNCYDPKIGRYRNQFVYRGVFDKNFKLLPKLNRICGHDLKLEDSIIRNFIKYGYSEIDHNSSLFQKVALGQHFGLPTRLLDWSYSPLVAAHFATVNTEQYDKDGVIYCVDLCAVNNLLPPALKSDLDNDRAHIFTIATLDKHFKNFKDFYKYSQKPFCLFFEPASSDDRMSNQYALFSMSSDTRVALESLLPDDDEKCFKLIIPKEIKLEIRDKLDYINISERFIMPGLDGICSWITRRYSNLKKDD